MGDFLEKLKQFRGGGQKWIVYKKKGVQCFLKLNIMLMKVRFDQYILQNFIHTCHCTKNESYFCTVSGQGINQNHRLSKLQGKDCQDF